MAVQKSLFRMPLFRIVLPGLWTGQAMMSTLWISDITSFVNCFPLCTVSCWTETEHVLLSFISSCPFVLYPPDALRLIFLHLQAERIPSHINYFLRHVSNIYYKSTAAAILMGLFTSLGHYGLVSMPGWQACIRNAVRFNGYTGDMTTADRPWGRSICWGRHTTTSTRWQ